MKIVKKILSLLVVATICLSLFIPSAFGENYLESYSDTGKKSSVTIASGGGIQLQFNAAKTFNKVGIVVSANDKDKVLEARLYKWVSNVRDTREGTLIASKTFESFERYDLIYVEGTFEPGEYMIDVRVSGSDCKFNWYSVAALGFCGYKDDYDYDGVPLAEIYFANGDTTDCMKEVTPTTALPYHTAPEEATIAEDSTIAKLNVDSTLYSFVDGLGRSAVTYEEAGEKNNKQVGIFYWTWHEGNANYKPVNVNSILDEYPEATNNYNHAIWKKNSVGSYFWNEPLWGYYKESDDYVLRKHAELLADAGIDFVIFDCTNGTHTWDSAFLNLCEVWTKAKEEGVNVPKIAFMLNLFEGGDNEEYTQTMAEHLYEIMYKNNLYQDLWFYLDGKPMIMAFKSNMDESDPLQAEIINFFTWRAGAASYWEDDKSNDYWGWLHVYPQAVYKRSDGSVEMTTVGVAMNANYKTMSLDAMNSGSNMGRGYSRQKNYKYTFTYRGEEIVCNSKMENAHYYGINFQEQWDYAMSVDPDIVFVTGWNEWIMGRYETWMNTSNAFPDQCNDENSRDIEPSTGELKDYYYYQLVNNVRKFKGVSKPVTQDNAKTIDINGDVSQWDQDGIISYNSYLNNTYERNEEKGWTGCKYTNDATRNDFVTSKVSYDKDNIYFYVETQNDITSYTDEAWMRLLLDTQVATADSKDWEEFEYIVGRETGTSDTLVLERSTGGWNWEKVCDVKYTVKGNVMQLEIPRSAIGLTSTEISFNFKWADQNLKDGDIMTLYTDGDSAPLGRFTYVFTSTGDLTEFVSETAEPVDDPEATQEPTKKKGCGGSIAETTILLIPVFLTALIKRKENI